MIRCISCFGSDSIPVTSSYRSVSGSCKKFRILTDPDLDPQHCKQIQVAILHCVPVPISYRYLVHLGKFIGVPVLVHFFALVEIRMGGVVS
jgi:hypothetical protein